MQQDIPIWEHKIYHARPMLCDGDGPISKYRRWFRQFYDDDPVAATEAESLPGRARNRLEPMRS